MKRMKIQKRQMIRCLKSMGISAAILLAVSALILLMAVICLALGEMGFDMDVVGTVMVVVLLFVAISILTYKTLG